MRFVANIKTAEGGRREVKFDFQFDATDVLEQHVTRTYLRRGESINMKVGREPGTTMPDIARIA
jgi:hypothetical protein